MELLRTRSQIRIIRIDNMNDFYDVSIKEYRLAEINEFAIVHLDVQQRLKCR